LREAGDGDPLARIARWRSQAIGVLGEPDLTITVTSTCRLHGGWSGAAVANGHRCGRWPISYGRWFSSRRHPLTWCNQTELIYHGTPSGIDTRWWH